MPLFFIALEFKEISTLMVYNLIYRRTVLHMNAIPYNEAMICKYQRIMELENTIEKNKQR